MHLQHDDACDDLDGGGIIRDVFHGTKRYSASSASEVRVRERAHDIQNDLCVGRGDEVKIMLMLPIMRCDDSLLGMIFFLFLSDTSLQWFFLLLHCWRLFLHFFATSGVGLSLVCNGCGQQSINAIISYCVMWLFSCFLSVCCC